MRILVLSVSVILVALSVATSIGAGAVIAGPPSGGPTEPHVATWPVDGPVIRPFEPPAGPYAPGHRGVDLATGPGTVVRTALPGVVTFSGEVGGARWVTIDHGGELVTTYGILGSSAVRPGDRLAAAEPVGHLADDAAHLDWGARLQGDYIDPLRLFGRWRPRLVPLPG